MNVAEVLRNIELEFDLLLGALFVRFHHEVVVHLVAMFVWLVLALTNLGEASLRRNVPQVIPVTYVRCHIVLDTDVSVGALAVRLHHELVIYAVFLHAGREWLVLATFLLLWLRSLGLCTASAFLEAADVVCLGSRSHQVGLLVRIRCGFEAIVRTAHGLGSVGRRSSS